MRLALGALVVVCLGVGLSVSLVVPLSAENPRAVLIRTSKPYGAVVSAIEKAGGRVTHQFKYVNGLAADVPEAALAAIERLAGAGNVGRDETIPLPAAYDPRSGEPLVAEAEADEIVPLEQAAPVDPENYTFNAELNGLAPLFADNKTGAGIVIAVIDSGYRPMFRHVAPERLIAPGINLVPGASEPPAISDSNGSHGTQVAGMAAANIAFCFSTANKLIAVAEFYGVARVSPGCPPGSRVLPMTGSAPGAQILPIKVFPAAGGGTPSSRTIAAMEAAIELRQKFDAGDPEGLNIKVVNMSLGGPTSAAARTLSDAAVEKLIEHDIVPVVSAGNEGFSSVTVSSPGTSFAALTVGAASTAVHERIVRAQFSLPCGLASVPLSQALNCALAWRPDDNIQMADFSSRGPTHDGRVDPDVVANGSFGYTQGSGSTATTVSFASGTSFSGPTVAGIAAVLRQAVPAATARQIRNAIIMSADPAKIPTATPNDQGAGFVNAAAALALLQAGTVPDSYATAHFTRSLPANMSRAGRRVYEGAASVAFTDVRPAEVAEVAFLVPANTEKLHARIHSIVAELPLAQQNAFFTDDVLLRIQSSAVHRQDRRPIPPPPPAPQTTSFFLPAGGDRTFTFDRPEAGVWRITPTGDWTNAGNVSFTVEVWISQESFPQYTVKADIVQNARHEYRIDVSAGTAALDVRLEWTNMQGRYPISDVDVILTPPTGPVVNSCNSSRAPELCRVTNPVAGTWTATVVGFSVPSFGIPGAAETYVLRVAADGVVLKPAR